MLGSVKTKVVIELAIVEPFDQSASTYNYIVNQETYNIYIWRLDHGLNGRIHSERIQNEDRESKNIII